MMEHGLDSSLEVALALLPIFLLIRFSSDYLGSSLQEELTLRALITALFQGFFVLILLILYKELLQILDTFIAHLMEHLGDPDSFAAYLEKSDDRLSEVREKHPYTWWIISAFSFLVGAIRKVFSWITLFSVRSMIMHIRGYFLVFSTQVGPLAIAASILPGKLGGTSQVWFKLHLSFLCWGITTAILDRILVSIDLAPWSIEGSIHDLITTAAFLLMYLFVGPLTSVYIGSTLGNSFYSAGLAGSQRLYQLTSRVIRRT
ncbi:MAG: hypothetical protein ACYC2U_04085 [Candidatus Amoebophilus sp.]